MGLSSGRWGSVEIVRGQSRVSGGSVVLSGSLWGSVGRSGAHWESVRSVYAPEKYDVIFSRIRYHIYEKSGVAYPISHNYPRIKVDSYDPFPLEKYLTFRNVITLIKLVFNKDKNNYYYNIFLEEATDFHDKQNLKNDNCLAVISLDVDLNKDENYYPQDLLKEY